MQRTSESASQQASQLRVLIAGGGTGGHVIPALAIARELRDKHGAEIRFVGTARGLETRLVPEAGFPLELVRSGQWKNVTLGTKLRTAFDLPLGVISCLRLIREFKPQVVVGVGGYASGPGMLAAVLKRVPTLAYEPNALPGMTNRRLGRWVSAAAVNFAQTTQYFRNAQVTGVPVRREIFAIGRRPAGSPRRLLVFGGSLGARILNETMPNIAGRLLKRFEDLEILHQAGGKHGISTAKAYEAVGLGGERAGRRVWVQPYLDDVPAALASTDLVLARSGATTVAELCAAGRPSLLVPFAAAADDHQRKNAEVLQRASAARMLVEAELTQETLLASLVDLLADLNVLQEMGERAKSMANPSALQRIAGMVVELARG